MKRVALLCAATIAALTLNSALAEDYNPPTWRGDPGTTRQQWEFTTFDGTPGSYNLVPPDLFSSNPAIDAGTFSVDYDPPDTDWVPLWQGATGVWRVESPGNITLELPNFDDDNPLKEIWMQITFAAENDEDPWVSTSPVYTPPITVTDKVANGDYWNVTYHITIEPNPASETIWIQPVGCTLYVDQIVVDTICTPEPASVMLLGLGAIGLLRRRKA